MRATKAHPVRNQRKLQLVYQHHPLPRHPTLFNLCAVMEDEVRQLQARLAEEMSRREDGERGRGEELRRRDEEQPEQMMSSS